MAWRTQRQWKHHVFLSFRGEDTRRGFISHLYHALHEVGGIRTFKDDRDIERGTGISPELQGAIEQSQLAVVVLSQNYASSTWCLDELTKILQCMEARNAILPIFYDVEPSDVGNQRGSFAEAFTKHEENFRQEPEKVKKWRAALTKVAYLSGWDSTKYESESALTEDIFNSVWKQVYHTLMLDPSEKIVGIDFKLKQLDLLLAPHEVNDVRFIGIWGMGGIGKTTIAKSVFDRISHSFKASCFLADVSKYSSPNALVDLQRQLLSQILKNQSPNVWDEGSGREMINNRFTREKVLLVLDDVDQLMSQKFVEQILVGNKDCFGKGSRIIITARDKRPLVELGIEKPYEVQGLYHDEALDLFRHHAFRDQEQYEECFSELSERFLNYARGLPLAVKILGKALYKRSLEEWKSQLDNLDKIPNPTIFDSLKMSYDGLDRMEQKIFLDVACFHKGKTMEEVINVINCVHDICSYKGIRVLVEKALLTLEKSDDLSHLTMHDLVERMAREIVRGESEHPSRRTRLCLLDDISQVIMTQTGTREIEGIGLRFPNPEEVRWDSEGFSDMRGLKFLELYNVIISSDVNFLPNSLRIIHWSWYPSKFLPPNFRPYFLTELRMYRSKLVRLCIEKKNFPNLKCIDLSFSEELTSISDFNGLPNLEVLILEGCENLVEIHPSFAVLKRLRILNLRYCESIRSLPNKAEMDSLETFDLHGCSKVKKIPEFTKQMKNLTRLFLGKTAIENLPSSIEHLVGLTELDMRYSKLVWLWNGTKNFPNLKCMHLFSSENLTSTPDFTGLPNLEELDILKCKNLVEIHPSFAVLKRLNRLHLQGCESIRSLPNKVEMDSLVSFCISGCSKVKKIPEFSEHMKNLTFLDLGGTAIEKIPSSIEHLVGLRNLSVHGCKNLLGLPTEICNLKSLKSLYTDGCSKLFNLPGELECLEYLRLGQTAIREPLVLMKKLKTLCMEGPPAKSTDPFNKGMALVLSTLNRLCHLVYLNLRHCDLCEGDIPDDIGRLSNLRHLYLCGNNFVSLPESIACLYKLRFLGLTGCKRLQQLRDLPSNGELYVNVDNCTSLKWLSDSDPSKLSRFGKSDGFAFSAANCLRLIEDEGWINCILPKTISAMLKRLMHPLFNLWPGSEIPEWFNNKSVGHSLHLEVPPLSCTNWLGIAFCVVFTDPRDPAGRPYDDSFQIAYSPYDLVYEIYEYLESEHILIFYKDRNYVRTFSGQVFFRTKYSGKGKVQNIGLNTVKKCGSRLVYEQDLEELSRTLKILKRTHEYSQEAGPSGSGS